MPLSSIKLTSEALQNSGLWDGVSRGWGTVGMKVISIQVQEKFGYMDAAFCWCVMHGSCGLLAAVLKVPGVHFFKDLLA